MSIQATFAPPPQEPDVSHVVNTLNGLALWASIIAAVLMANLALSEWADAHNLDLFPDPGDSVEWVVFSN